MKFLTLMFYFFLNGPLEAYTIAIYTDEPGATKAKEVIELVKNTYPFNQYEINFKIEQVQPERLNCGPQHGIARLIGCDTENIASDAAKKRINQVLIVKNSDEYGGSGGAIPIITSSSPASTALHEYLHTLGFCDEYEYSREEANYYCTVGGPNLALIEPLSGGYTSDKQARSLHMKQIPWSKSILETTLITRVPYLGTGNVNRNVYAVSNTTPNPSYVASAIGLYRAQTCNKAFPIKTSWQPGREVSIMENLEAGLGRANEEIVDQILQSKGIKRFSSATRALSNEVKDNRFNDKFISSPLSDDNRGGNTRTK